MFIYVTITGNACKLGSDSHFNLLIMRLKNCFKVYLYICNRGERLTFNLPRIRAISLLIRNFAHVSGFFGIINENAIYIQENFKYILFYWERYRYIKPIKGIRILMIKLPLSF